MILVSLFFILLNSKFMRCRPRNGIGRVEKPFCVALFFHPGIEHFPHFFNLFLMFFAVHQVHLFHGVFLDIVELLGRPDIIFFDDFCRTFIGFGRLVPRITVRPGVWLSQNIGMVGMVIFREQVQDVFVTFVSDAANGVNIHFPIAAVGGKNIFPELIVFSFQHFFK